jgi:hypothetical protein
VALAVVGVLVLAGVTLSDKLPGLIGSSAGGNEPAPTLAPDQPVATSAPDQPVAARARADPPVAAKRVLTLSPRSGTMTTRVTATGTGFTPGVQVQLVFAAENIPDDATVADDGSFRASFAVPEFYGDFPNRTYDVKAYERDSAYYATASFTLNA